MTLACLKTDNLFFWLRFAEKANLWRRDYPSPTFRHSFSPYIFTRPARGKFGHRVPGSLSPVHLRHQRILPILHASSLGGSHDPLDLGAHVHRCLDPHALSVPIHSHHLFTIGPVRERYRFSISITVYTSITFSSRLANRRNTISNFELCVVNRSVTRSSFPISSLI